MSEVVMVKLDELVENPQSLRGVTMTTEAYQELLESIRSLGFISTISVRKVIINDEEKLMIVDGLHRTTAAREAGLEEVPAIILEDKETPDETNAASIITQFKMNNAKVETKPKEYSQAIEILMAQYPNMTKSEMAGLLGISTQKLSKLMTLKRIENDKIIELVDNGTLPFIRACTLALLDNENQLNLLESAIGDDFDTFQSRVDATLKDIREARNKGLKKNKPSFVPVAKIRKLKEITDFIKNKEAMTAYLASIDCQNISDAFEVGLKWAISLDPISYNSQKETYELKLKQREARKKAAEAERRKKQLEKKEKELQELNEALMSTGV